MDTLKIFVSGTIDDMLSERKAVGDAIRSLHLDAVRAETEYSENRSSRAKCVEMAQWCDIYLGVYNKTRYGWTIPADGISVTEMEFNEAQARKKTNSGFGQQVAARLETKGQQGKRTARKANRVSEPRAGFRRRQVPRGGI